MMDGWPVGYDGWMATIHDECMEEKWGRLGPGSGPLNDGTRAPFFIPSQVHSGENASAIFWYFPKGRAREQIAQQF